VKVLVQWLIDWPRRLAGHLGWLAPLVARIVVGWVFLWSGWGKLHSLPQVTQNFIEWGIPLPHILTPFVSGVEFFGGLFLLLGLLTRISAGALGITMIVAIKSAKWADVDSLETLLGFRVRVPGLVPVARHRRSRQAGSRPVAAARFRWARRDGLPHGKPVNPCVGGDSSGQRSQWPRSKW